MSKDHFSTFEPVSKENWKAKIVKDLKGKDYDESLLWKTEEDIVVDPIYHSEDLEQLFQKYDSDVLAVGNKQTNSWEIVERVIVSDPKSANEKALAALNNGAEAIEFNLNSKAVNQTVIESLTEGILSEFATVSFTNFNSIEGSLNLEQSNLFEFRNDVITRNLLDNKSIETSDLLEWKTLLLGTNGQSFYIDGAVYQNAGADIKEQLAFIIGLGVEYLELLDDTELASIKTCSIKVGVSSNYFFEIAKLRALRKLWKVVLAQYGMNDCELKIIAESTSINKSKLDVYTNMLRNTSECMSAVIGGADEICINAHDQLNDDSEKGRRWARNISHILRNESYFDKVNDPGKGSYYIEALTDELAEASWKLFKEVEQRGGFLSDWKSGTITSLIKESRAKKIERFLNGKKILIGVNKYNKDLNANARPSKEVKSTEILKPLRLAAFYELSNPI